MRSSLLFIVTVDLTQQFYEDFGECFDPSYFFLICRHFIYPFLLFFKGNPSLFLHVKRAAQFFQLLFQQYEVFLIKVLETTSARELKVRWIYLIVPGRVLLGYLWLRHVGLHGPAGLLSNRIRRLLSSLWWLLIYRPIIPLVSLTTWPWRDIGEFVFVEVVSGLVGQRLITALELIHFPLVFLF